MARLNLLFIPFFIFCSCGKEKKETLPVITERFIKNNERSCERITATRYETIDELLQDFIASAKYKDSLELNVRLGTYYHYREEYDSALFFYGKAESIDATDADLHFNMALAYSEKSEFERALKSIENSLVLCGERWEYLNSKCYILGSLNRCEEAVKIGLISKAINPENKKIYGNLLRCFDKLNQRDSVLRYITLIDSKFNQTADWINELKKRYNQQ